MTLEEKKGFVLRYARLGMDPLSSMIVAECTDDEIAVLEADKSFQRSLELVIKLEESQLLEKFHTAMKNNLSRDDTRDAKWFLEKVSTRFANGTKVSGNGKNKVNIQIDFGSPEDMNTADNVEVFEGADTLDDLT